MRSKANKRFDTIDHDLLMKAVEWKVQERWILQYIGRWLKVPCQTNDGQLIERTMGVPQGSVIGPVLANLFLHCVFDKWMETNYPEVPFERYADDTICHLRTREEAEHMKEVIMQRFSECKLTLNDEKTKIVHCEDSNRRDGGEGCENSFIYLGYEFRPRAARNSKTGQVFTAFTPAMSKKAVKKIKDEMKSWNLHKKLQWSVNRIAEEINPKVRGWYNYYTKFGKTEFRRVMRHLNDKLARWAIRKYKEFKKHPRKAYAWLENLSRRETGMFAHWSLGYLPQCAK